jgi:hypothetical protein
MRRLLFIALLAALAPYGDAQRFVSAGPRFASGFSRGGFSRSSFYPLPLFDPLYSEYLSGTGYPVASQPPVIFLQAQPAPDRSPSPVQPLTIELQGDRYVRVSGPEASETAALDRAAAEPATAEPAATARVRSQPQSGSTIPAVPAQLPPAVLVFRDGHHEEISDYTIADGILYTRADYYTTGSWTRKIELSSLNLPETIQTNQSRGARFQLPSAPNEVIVRP